MVASDVETSVAANGVRENVLACTGGGTDIDVAIVLTPNHPHPHPYHPNHHQHDHQETRGGEKDRLTLMRIASLRSTRVVPTEEIPPSPSMEGQMMIADQKYENPRQNAAIMFYRVPFHVASNHNPDYI